MGTFAHSFCVRRPAIANRLNSPMDSRDANWSGLLDPGRLVSFGRPWEIANTDVLPDVFACSLAVIPHPNGPQPLVVPYGCDTKFGDEVPPNVRTFSTRVPFPISD